MPRGRSQDDEQPEGDCDGRLEREVERFGACPQVRIGDHRGGLSERLPDDDGRDGREDGDDGDSRHHDPPTAARNAKIAGPSSTTNMAGKIRKTSGNRILIGAFCARSSAWARRRFRMSVASPRMLWPIETPSVSPCRT